MQQSVVSSKIIVYSPILGIGYLIITTIVRYMMFTPHIIACNESSGTTYVIKISRSYEIVIPTTSVKDSITCMGRSMAFYDRNIDVMVLRRENDTYYTEIAKRYSVEEVSISDVTYQDMKLTYINGRYLLNNKGGIYALYPQSIASPFEITRTGSNKDIDLIIAPELDDDIQNILLKAQTAKLVPFMPIPEGEYKKIIL